MFGAIVKEERKTFLQGGFFFCETFTHTCTNTHIKNRINEQVPTLHP